MTQSLEGGAPRGARAWVDRGGVVVVSLPAPVAASAVVVARRRADGAEVRAVVDSGSSTARLTLPVDEGDPVWDLYLVDDRPVRLTADDSRLGPAVLLADGRALDAYRTVKGNLSVRVRPRRPRADVERVDLGDGFLTITARLHEVEDDVEVVSLLGRSRHSESEILAAASCEDGQMRGSVPYDQLVSVPRLRHHTVDVYARLTTISGQSSDLRLRRPGTGPAETYPIIRTRTGQDEIDVQLYFTAKGNLSVRVGAGSPPGVGIVPGAKPRRPAPKAVRRLVDLYLRRVARRTAAASVRERGPLGTDRPRVYFLIRSAYGVGGTIRTVLTTANHLAEQGYRVELISVLRPKQTTFFEVHPRIRHTWLFDERTRYGALVTIATGEHPVRALVRRVLSKRLDQWESLLTHPREVVFGRSSLLTDLLLVRRLQRLRPGVLVLTRPVLNVVGARFAAPQVRTVGQEHMNFSLHSPDVRDWMLAAYPELDVLSVLTSGDQRDYGAALAGAPVVVRRIPNGLPRLPERVSDQDAKVVVAAGRLTRQKGFDLLIRAFSSVAARRPDWSLRIFGDGPQQDELQRLIGDLGLTRSVHLMGRTSQMHEQMVRASVYALSSRFEGFGMVVIEAMAAGLPVVSFDCPRGPADIITHGTDGLLVPAEDVRALAAGLLTLIDDEQLRRSMAQQARATARRYSMDELGVLWEDLLRELGTAQRWTLPADAPGQPSPASQAGPVVRGCRPGP